MNVTITIPGITLARVFLFTVGRMPKPLSEKERGELIEKAVEQALLAEMRQWCIDNNCHLQGDDYSPQQLDYALTGSRHPGDPISDLAVTFRFASDADALFFKMRWF